ncbi:guanylate kinase [Carnobacterium iners]|uniref:Guanylate kinase n=1 Tax=Carnobacterium iners TaxID=1073423 RepID=A0A1X7N4Z0_9LACT|nr:AAA family ATPase [Carnobacterium iners]SEL28667.1 guanylate kinase [Carnobacterium iners]SMH32444.1 guanylate kinase [Carnobacterium iners]
MGIEQNKVILVLVGVSGSGKTTLANALEKTGIPKLVTTTTRPKREGEVEGLDYYFREMTEMSNIAFIENSLYNHYLYGLTVDTVEKGLDFHDVMSVVLDKNGAAALKEVNPFYTKIIYLHISEDEIQKRMEKRGDSLESIQQRLAFARETNEFEAPVETDLTLPVQDVEKSVECILSFIKNGLQ